MEQKALVYNIQRFSTHDGPGIRTTVFLKGCPLNCVWCSNPESILPKSQLMMRHLKCCGCGECLDICQEGAITLSSHSNSKDMDWKRCKSCFSCVEQCIYGALTIMGKSMSVKEIISEIEKDEIFYKNSEGGITFSGGEPLNQHQILGKLLKEIKAKGFHISIDTTGHAKEEVVRNILSQADLVLFDIKHMDTKLHKEYTGVGNELILKNARIATQVAKTWFRIPLIAGINDSKENIEQLAKLAHSLGVEKISLLPYHEGGVSKSHQIGSKRDDFIANRPDDLHIDELVSIINSEGVPVTIGQ